MKKYCFLRVRGLIAFFVVSFVLCALNGCKSIGKLSSHDDSSAHNSMNFPDWN